MCRLKLFGVEQEETPLAQLERNRARRTGFDLRREDVPSGFQ
jgi:hypothetical protein